MSKAIIRAEVFVNNCPLSLINREETFMVARNVDSELWYYGMYQTFERAKSVAKELENGIVLEVLDNE